MSHALELIVASIEAKTGKAAKRSGSKVMCVCTHDDAKKHNLSITDGNDRVLLHCFSRQCDPKDVLESVGLSIADIYHTPLNPQQKAQQKIIINDRQIKHDLEIELLILLQWLSAFYSNMFPEQERDTARVLLAMQRIKKVTCHYIESGI